jgi:hypothetical protein
VLALLSNLGQVVGAGGDKLGQVRGRGVRGNWSLTVSLGHPWTGCTSNGVWQHVVDVHLLKGFDRLIADPALVAGAGIPEDSTLSVVERALRILLLKHCSEDLPQDLLASLPLIQTIGSLPDRSEVPNVKVVSLGRGLQLMSQVRDPVNLLGERSQKASGQFVSRAVMTIDDLPFSLRPPQVVIR